VTAATIIERMVADGVKLTITAAGTIKAKGPQDAVNRWLPLIRENKAALLETLTHDNRFASADLASVACRRDSEGTRHQAQVLRPATSLHRRIAASATQSQTGAHANTEERLTDPDMPLTAATLTLPCHTVGNKPTNARIAHTALETADLAADTRRQQALSMLAANPDITHAIVSHTEIETDSVIVTLAIRDKATCELRIPKAKYDAFAVLRVIEQHTGPTANITRGIKGSHND
jgi:hypothetical protein